MKTLTPKTLDWIDQAPVSITRTRRIAAPQDEVWAAIADHAGWTSWFPRLVAVTPGPTADAVGGTRTVDLGAAAVDEEFLAWETERHFAFTVTASTKPGLRSMVEDIRLTRDGDTATTVTYTMGIDPVGGKLLRPVAAPLLRKVIADGLAGLARHVQG